MILDTGKTSVDKFNFLISECSYDKISHLYFKHCIPLQLLSIVTKMLPRKINRQPFIGSLVHLQIKTGQFCFLLEQASATHTSLLMAKSSLARNTQTLRSYQGWGPRGLFSTLRTPRGQNSLALVSSCIGFDMADNFLSF